MLEEVAVLIIGADEGQVACCHRRRGWQGIRVIIILGS